jgi:hypothetical protein
MAVEGAVPVCGGDLHHDGRHATDQRLGDDANRPTTADTTDAARMSAPVLCTGLRFGELLALE